MPWVKIDDKFAEHPKMKEATPLGMAMQVAGLCYCNKYLTDGFIQDSVVEHLLALEFTIDDKPGEDDPITYVIKMFAGRESFMRRDLQITPKYLAELLVACDVWERREGGYYIHDYEKYQFTRDELDQIHETKQKAGRAGGVASGKARKAKTKQK